MPASILKTAEEIFSSNRTLGVPKETHLEKLTEEPRPIV